MEYYADYPAEIDAWLAKVDAQAAEAEELFRRLEAPGAAPAIAGRRRLPERRALGA